MLFTFTCLLVVGSVAVSAQTACTVNHVKGTCKVTTSCTGKSVAGHCPGAANNQCCIPTGTSCTANGKSGSCVATSACAGTAVAGHCPGAASIQCCVASGGASGSANGLCGSYAGAAVSSIKGNGNVAYSVVKIRTEHLTNPAIHTAAPTAADNTMTTTTACAFDKMAAAAKQAGVAIKIASGFRTVARQEYFWNCYQTKSCNNGNLAARPGTSNHGKGIALDLNTDCGSQSGAKPNCGGSKVYQWLYKNGAKYGFKRTVQSEPWHWEYVGAGATLASFS
ncbi:unnamed protein product [Adineta steineri]|uniref:D-alanyl-D-alanine carboxypeptidase-like core domain-containing protein n=3 Tax=Adineta steineri TaxID=433720 RepID=A0A814KEL9_9BILA|nr:unnamed protein product [Adineta steineri]CAF1051454.1 unnamed protein product [Adineta steineri]